MINHGKGRTCIRMVPGLLLSVIKHDDRQENGRYNRLCNKLIP